MEERIISSFKEYGDEEEISLRPQSLDEYIGQYAAKDNLRVFINAAKIRKES